MGKHPLLGLLLVLAGSVLIHGSAVACKCAVRTVEQKLAGSTSVFRGIVVEATPLGNSASPALVVRYTFDVSKTWKGDSRGTLDVSSGTVSAACGMTFELGREYLIYADGESVSLGTSLCAGNMSTSSASAGEEIAELDRLAPNRVVPGEPEPDQSELQQFRRTMIGAGLGVTAVQNNGWQIGPAGEIWGRYAFTPGTFVRARVGYAGLGENVDTDEAAQLGSPFLYSALEGGLRILERGSISPYLLLGVTLTRGDMEVWSGGWASRGGIVTGAPMAGIGIEISADEQISLFTELTGASTFTSESGTKAFRNMLALKAGAGWSF